MKKIIKIVFGTSFIIICIILFLYLIHSIFLIKWITIKINIEEIDNIILSFLDKEKYNTLFNKEYYGEYVDPYIEFPIEEEYWNDLVNIINRSKFRGVFKATFGPMYDMPYPDYRIKICYNDGRNISIQIWHGNHMFQYQDWHIIREEDFDNFYNILYSLKINNINN